MRRRELGRGVVMHLILWVVLLSCFGTGAWCDEDVGGPEFEIVTCGSAIKLQHVSTVCHS